MVGWLMSDRELGKVLGVRLESFFFVFTVDDELMMKRMFCYVYTFKLPMNCMFWKSSRDVFAPFVCGT